MKAILLVAVLCTYGCMAPDVPDAQHIEAPTYRGSSSAREECEKKCAKCYTIGNGWPSKGCLCRETCWK